MVSILLRRIAHLAASTGSSSERNMSYDWSGARRRRTIATVIGAAFLLLALAATVAAAVGTSLF
jgi:hypothetical protein